MRALEFNLMLAGMHSVGVALSENEGAFYRHWGLHLLEDWKSLELLAQKIESELDDEQDQPG